MYPANIIENLNGLDTRMFAISGFTPTDIAGLQLWLDANDSSTLFTDAAKTTSAGDGDVVGAWADKSGNVKDATQTTTSKKPTLHTGVVNGLPVVRVDAADDTLLLGDYSALTASEIFIVIKVANDPALATRGHWIFGSASGGGSDSLFPFTDGAIYDDFGSNARKTTGNPVVTLAQFNLYNVVSIAGEWTSRLNNTQHFTTGTNTVGFDTVCELGRSLLGSLDGDIAEVILYNSKLSADNRALINNYLSDKYGITLS